MPVPNENFFGTDDQQATPASAPTVPLDPDMVIPSFGDEDSWPEGTFPVDEEAETEEQPRAARRSEPEQETEDEPEDADDGGQEDEVAALRRELQELRSERQAASDPRQAYQQIQEMLSYQERLREWQEQQQREMEPPEFNHDELLEGPEKAQQILRAYAEYGARQATSQMAPYVSEAATAARILNHAYPVLADTAEARAYELAESSGLVESREDFDALLPQAFQLMQEYDPNGVVTMRLNPQNIFHAVTIARNQGGKPLKKKPKQPKSLDAGDRSEERRTAPKSHPQLSEIESAFGVKIDPKDKQKYAAKYSKKRRVV